MLSFENALDCFALVIQTGICEVLLTRHGYVVMEWDEEEREWFNVTHCDTPAALREAILSAYEDICNSRSSRIATTPPKKKYARYKKGALICGSFAMHMAR